MSIKLLTPLKIDSIKVKINFEKEAIFQEEFLKFYLDFQYPY